MNRMAASLVEALSAAPAARRFGVRPGLCSIHVAPAQRLQAAPVVGMYETFSRRPLSVRASASRGRTGSAAAMPARTAAAPLRAGPSRRDAPSPFPGRRIRKGLPVLPPRMSVRVRAVEASPDAPSTSAAAAGGFGALGLSLALQDAVREMGITVPTEIQALSFRKIRAGGDWILASHTGSGKTLGYLLPVVQRLKELEAEATPGGAAFMGRPKRPRAVVLGPTRELTDQIFRVCKALSHVAKFRAGLVNAGRTKRDQRLELERPLDVLVATPASLREHMEAGHVYVGDVRFLVLDEADTMFDRGFGPEVAEVVAAVKGKPSPADAVLACATLSRKVQKLVLDHLPKAERIATDTFHRGVAGSQHSFVTIPPGRDKLDVLEDALSTALRDGERAMVFGNTQAAVRAAEHHLRERGIPTVCYHGEMPRDARREAIEAFAGAHAQGQGQGQGRPPVMVCSDLAARGLDVPGRVDLVVNFDFPLTAVDYLHRTGRTARAGAPGRVTSLVAKRDRVLAARIEWALQRGEPLDELSADKNVLPPGQRPSEATQAKRREESVRLRGRGQRGAARKEVMEERRERGGKAKAAKMAQRQKGRARRMEFKGR